jgi:predicted secreted protein
MVQRCKGATCPVGEVKRSPTGWCNGGMVEWCKGRKVERCKGATCPVGEVKRSPTGWCNGRMVQRCNGRKGHVLFFTILP